MKKDKITQEELRELVTYDPDTGVMLFKERPGRYFKKAEQSKQWNARFAGKPVGNKVTARCGVSYLGARVGGFRSMVHRLAWVYMYGCLPTGVIDHINGDGMDNRIENLRDATHSENHCNSKRYRTNSSGITGVSFCKRTGRWESYIEQLGKRSHLGRHASFFEACCARKSAERYMGFHENHGRQA